MALLRFDDGSADAPALRVTANQAMRASKTRSIGGNQVRAVQYFVELPLSHAVAPDVLGGTSDQSLDHWLLMWWTLAFGLE